MKNIVPQKKSDNKTICPHVTRRFMQSYSTLMWHRFVSQSFCFLAIYFPHRNLVIWYLMKNYKYHQMHVYLVFGASHYLIGRVAATSIKYWQIIKLMWYYIYNNRWNIYSKFILFHCVYFLVASTHHLKEGRLTLYLRNVKKKIIIMNDSRRILFSYNLKQTKLKSTH